MTTTLLAGAQALPAADQLFRDGLAELKAGNLPRACTLIADSYALDPQPGALFTLAECEARAGKLATAATRFQGYVDQVRASSPAERRRQAERVRAAEQRLLELGPRLPLLTIVPPPDLPDGAELRSDDAVLPRSAWSSAMPVDPGSHVIVLALPDGRSVRRELTLGEGEALSVTLELPPPPPPVEPVVVVEPAPTPPAKSPPPPPKVAPPPEPAPTAAGTGPRRALTYTAFGVGTAGVVVGSIAGAILISRKSTVDAHCPAARCDDEGYEATRDIPTLDTIANVGFVVGALGLGTGLVLLLTEPSPARPAIGLSANGAVLRGTF